MAGKTVVNVEVGRPIGHIYDNTCGGESRYVHLYDVGGMVIAYRDGSELPSFDGAMLRRSLDGTGVFGGCVGLRCIGKSGYRAVGALNGMRDGDILTLSCGAFDADVSLDGGSFTCRRVSDGAFGSARDLMDAFCDAVGKNALERDMDDASRKWVDGVGCAELWHSNAVARTSVAYDAASAAFVSRFRTHDGTEESLRTARVVDALLWAFQKNAVAAKIESVAFDDKTAACVCDDRGSHRVLFLSSNGKPDWTAFPRPDMAECLVSSVLDSGFTRKEVDCCDYASTDRQENAWL